MKDTSPISRNESVRGYPERILLKASENRVFVNTNNIVWISSTGNYAKLNLKEDNFLIRTTLKRLEKKLNPFRFVRIHHSHIVNIDEVTSIKPWFSGDAKVELKNGKTLKMSRNYKDNLDKFRIN